MMFITDARLRPRLVALIILTSQSDNTYLQLVPTTRVWVSTEIMNETISVEHTLTDTQTQTQINTYTATATQASLYV